MLNFKRVLNENAKEEIGQKPGVRVRRKKPEIVQYEKKLAESLLTLSERKIEKTRRAYGCRICLNRFESQRDLESHIVEQHNFHNFKFYSSKYPWCERCNQDFENIEEFEKHKLENSSCDPAGVEKPKYLS